MDAPRDASPDADPKPVKVTALTYAGDGLPDLAARMIFQDPEGNVVFEGPVDATGKLEAVLPNGGTVTEVRIVADTSSTLEAQITTIMGVESGDDLTFGFKASPTIVNQGGQTTMSANFTPAPGAANHHFYTACGVTSAGVTSPATLVFRDSCRAATFDLLVVASGGTLPVPQFIRLPNVEYQSGQAFTVPGGYTTMVDFTVAIANVPAEISNLTVTRSSMLKDAAVAPQSVAIGDPDAGTVSVEVPFASGVGTRSQVSLTFSRSDALGAQQHSLHTASLAPRVDVDLGLQRMPWLRDLAVNATGLTWSPAVQGDLPDGMVAVWNGRWTDDRRVTTVGWRIVQPFNPTGLALPRLSTTHAAVDPQAQTVPVVPSSGGVSIVDFDIVAGYGEFRQQPDTLAISSIDMMGAFVGLPYQRRMYTANVLIP